MKVLNKSPLQNEEKQATNLLAENLNNESSSSSHVQRYINTLAVVEEEQRSILMVESASLIAMALCLENNANSCCDLITSDSQNISNLRREMNSAPQNVELEMSTTASNNTQRDGNSSSGNPRHSTMDIRQLDLDEIQVDSSQYQTTSETDRYHIETAVAILDDHDQVEITTFAAAAAAEGDQSLQQQQEQQQHPPPTSN